MTKAKPLAQTYTVVFEKPDVAGTMIDTPSITRLPNGRLLSSNNIDGSWGGGIGQAGLDSVFPGGRNVYIHASDDNGETWRTLNRLPLADGMLLTLEGNAYVLGTGRLGEVRRDVYVGRSTDGGETWGDLVQIHDGPAWNSATGVVFRNGHLYRAYDTASHQAGRRLFVLAGNMNGDLLNPGSWRCSNTVGFPGLPEVMKRPVNPSFHDHWLEPNVVNIRGRLTVIARCRIDNYGTCHLVGVCDLSDTDGDLKLEFTQFHPFPGGQQKFHILYDELSDLYWMVGNLVTDPQDHTGWHQHATKRGYKGGAGNERRILALFYSVDSLNWFQAGIVAMSADPMQGFMYSQMLVDGNDLIFVVRTSRERGNNHDAELVTFHRLLHFRSLALDIHPGLGPGIN